MSRLILAVVALAAAVEAFTPSHPATTSATTSKTTLFISSAKASSYTNPALDNPAVRIQAYLKEPQAVEARSTLEGTCLVSGLVAQQPTSTTSNSMTSAQRLPDQFLFDLINHEESAFEFNKIIAFVDDVAYAKKRLLSRSARYTGLLDKLDFLSAAYDRALPSVDQIANVDTWVAVVENTGDGLEQVSQIVAIAKNSKNLKNLAILLTEANELDVAECNKIVSSLNDVTSSKPLKYTLCAVGHLRDHPEGQEAYQFAQFGSDEGKLPDKAVFSGPESLRILSEMLQLESGSNKALTFAEVYNVNATEVKLVKGLRQAGYARMQEIDHMLQDGVKNYQKAVDEWTDKYPDAAKGYTNDAWWEQEIYQKSRRDTAERDAAKIEAAKSERQKDIEVIAKEWIKREYFRRNINSGNTLDKDEFEKEYWDRAMFEADLKYRQSKGEDTDPDSEWADFNKLQERKQAAMLKRAKAEMSEILESEGLGGLNEDDSSDAKDGDKPDEKK